MTAGYTVIHEASEMVSNGDTERNAAIHKMASDLRFRETLSMTVYAATSWHRRLRGSLQPGRPPPQVFGKPMPGPGLVDECPRAGR